MKKAKSLIAFLVAVMMLFSACQSASSPSGSSETSVGDTSSVGNSEGNASYDGVTIRFLNMKSADTDEGKGFIKLLDKFQEETGITVQYETAQDADMKAKVRTEAAADTLPDVFEYWSDYANAQFLYEADLLMEMDALIDALPDDNLAPELFIQSYTDSYKYNDKVYGLPFYASLYAFFYNIDIYEDCGLALPDTYDVYTYDQWREDGAVMREKGYIPFSTGFLGGNPGHQWLWAICSQFEVWDEARQAEVLAGANPIDDGFGKAMEVIQTDINMGMYPDDYMNGDWNTMLALFGAGQAACMYNLAHNVTELPDGMNIGVSYIPQLDGAVKDTSKTKYANPEHSLMTPKTSYNESPERQAAILKFYDFFYSDETLHHFSIYNELDGLNYKVDPEIKHEYVQKVYATQEGWTSHPTFMVFVLNSDVMVEWRHAVEEGASFMTTPEEYQQNVFELFKYDN